MSKSAVTQAIYDYLTPTNSNIPNLGIVYKALPKTADESELFTNTFPGLGVGVAIYMFIGSQIERRIAFGGPHSGHKFRIYDLKMLIVCKSDLEKTEDGQTAFDEFMDNLLAFIQDNRIANAPGVVFSWGEGQITTGGPDIAIQYIVPRTADGQVTIFQAVATVKVAEDILT